MNPEKLLAHSDFVRRLSRKLILDMHLAEDITQETMLAALKKPPTIQHSLQAWLSITLRNIVHTMRRKEGSKRRRETAVAIPEGIPSTEEIVEQEETRRCVVQAVLSLDEPYRSPVLLRFYQGLSHPEIAERLNVPIETMRTRLKRGLAQLRKKLDVDFEGNRRKWCLILAPFAGLKMTASPGRDFADLAPSPSGTESSSKFKIHLILGPILALVCWLVVSTWLEKSDPVQPDLQGVDAGNDGVLPPSRSDPDREPSFPREMATPRLPLVSGRTELSGTPSKPVTWQGRVIDYTGLPLSPFEYNGQFLGGIKIRARRMEATSASGDRLEVYACEGTRDGSFEFKSVAPGEYTVSLAFPGQSGYPGSFSEWGEVKIEGSGTVVVDIPLSAGRDVGAAFCGRIIDLDTDQPLKRLGVSLCATTTTGSACRFISTPVSPEDGSFTFRCLPTGVYDLILNGPDVYTKYYPRWIEVYEGQIIEDICFTVPPLGEFRLVLPDLYKDEIKDLKISITPLTGYDRSCHPDQIIGNVSVFLAAGQVDLRIVHEKLGSCTRCLDISQNKLTELVVLRSDLKKNQEILTLSGSVNNQDGSPVSNALLAFSSQRSSAKYYFFGETDHQGEFSIRRFTPGRWSMECSLFPAESDIHFDDVGSLALTFPPHPKVYFHNILILEDGPDPTLVDLTVPGGAVRGTLIDDSTGLPLGEGVPPWKVFLKAYKQGVTRIAYFEGHRSSAFHLQGIPKGKFMLAVNVPMYLDFQSDLFILTEDQVLDFGAIRLKQTGALDLEVLTLEGEPIPSYMVTCNGKLVPTAADWIDPNPTEKNWYTGLPPGPLTIKVTADHYREEEIFLNIEPGIVAKARVLLQSE